MASGRFSRPAPANETPRGTSIETTMRVLLHTPLKPPDHPTPSGDREMARGLQRLLRRLGHRVLMPEASRVPPGVPLPEAHLVWERWARRRAAHLTRRWRILP